MSEFERKIWYVHRRPLGQNCERAGPFNRRSAVAYGNRVYGNHVDWWVLRGEG